MASQVDDGVCNLESITVYAVTMFSYGTYLWLAGRLPFLSVTPSKPPRSSSLDSLLSPSLAKETSKQSSLATACVRK